MDYSQYQHIVIEINDGVALLTINRPEVMNATNAKLHNELSRVWLDLGQDPEVRVTVITGAGNAFSAGGDFELIENTIGNADLVAATMQEASDIVHNMINLDKPVISAINGVAVGAGLAVAMLADISIAAEDARITDGHVRLGVAAGDHASVIWPLLCGMAKAKYYLLTCDSLDGKEAERIGLVNKALPDDELMPHALAMAGRLATGPIQSIRAIKRAVRAGQSSDLSTSLDIGASNYGILAMGEDHHEAVDAFLEKRAPNFEGTSS